MSVAALVVELPAGSFVSWLVTYVKIDDFGNVKIDDFGTLFAEIGIYLMPEALDIIGY